MLTFQRTYTPEDFQSLHTRHVDQRYALVRAGSQRIQHIIMETMHLCEANWTLPEWNDYVQHVRSIVLAWLKSYITDMLRILSEQLEFDETKWCGDGLRLVPVPLIEIKMELIDGHVEFVPPFDTAFAQLNMRRTHAQRFAHAASRAFTSAAHEVQPCDRDKTSDKARDKHDKVPSGSKQLPPILEQDGSGGAAGTWDKISGLPPDGRQMADERHGASEASKEASKTVHGSRAADDSKELHKTVLERASHSRADRSIKSLRALVKSWQESIMDLAQVAGECVEEDTCFYYTVVKSDSGVSSVLERIETALVQSKDACLAFRVQFDQFSFLWEMDPTVSFDHFLKTQGQPPGEPFPRLSTFDAKLREFEALQRRIKSVLDMRSVLWLRIDTRPLKTAVNELLMLWAHTHTSYLSDLFARVLADIHTFITTTHTELEHAIDVHGGKDLLVINMLNSNRSIRLRRAQIEESFQPLEEIAMFLNSHARPVSRTQMEICTNLVLYWAELQKFALQIKEKFAPFIAVEIEQLVGRVSNFAHAESETHKAMSNAPFRRFDTGCDEAYANIATFYGVISSHKAEGDAIMQQEDLLEHSVGHDFSRLISCEATLRNFKNLWDTISAILSMFEEWKGTLWSDAHPLVYIDIVSAFQSALDGAEDEAKASDAYQKILDEVQDMAAALPMVCMLQDPALRLRHWEHLMEVGSVMLSARQF